MIDIQKEENCEQFRVEIEGASLPEASNGVVKLCVQITF